jgi:hypothetical protein
MHHPAAVLLGVILSVTLLQAQRFALIVGQNHGGEAVDNLKYAEADAEKFATLLRDIGGFASADINLVLRPDSVNFAAAIDSMEGRIAKCENPGKTLLFFYYSGHADAEGLLLNSTHCSFAAFRSSLSRIPAGIRIAVLDACQSGVVAAAKGGTRAEPFFFNERQQAQGEIWIASASASEQAQESATLRSSLFSFHFSTGLHGSADVSGDGRITMTEAYQYAYRKTLETSALTTGILQHPVYRFNITGEGDIVLVDLSGRCGGVVVDGTCKGTFLILGRNYTDVFADFYKEPGCEKFVALGPGDYTIINARQSGDIGLRQISVRGRATVRCAARQFHPSLLPYTRTAPEK